MTRGEAYYILRVAQEEIRTRGHTELDLIDLPYLDVAISALREQPRWVSVEEILPENKCECLVYVKTHKKRDGYITVSWFYPCYDGSAPDMKGRKVWTGYDSEWGVFELRCVTHWMPLPDAPEEDT